MQSRRKTDGSIEVICVRHYFFVKNDASFLLGFPLLIELLVCNDGREMEGKAQIIMHISVCRNIAL